VDLDTRLDIRRLSGHIGAELRGLDLSGDPADEAVDAFYAALLEYHVVFVPDQFLGPGELLALGARLGEILRNPTSPKVDGFPDVTELVTHDGGAPDIWHFDTSYVAVPPKASILSMVKTPPVGGDTLFVDLAAVYESLSPSMRDFLTGLTVRYESPKGVPGYEAEHPLVRAHPETGRRSLCFDPMYATRVVELHKEEGRSLLAFLRAYVADPTFACRYHWEDGTIAMWDNRCTLHRVASDYEGERIIHRVTIADDGPITAPPAEAGDG
jgi:taurine dioxygenase